MALSEREQAIVKGFRTEYPMYDSTRISDEEVLPRMYKTHYSHVDPDKFEDAMQTRFAPDWKPAPVEAPAQPSLAQKGMRFLKDTGQAIKESAIAAPAAMGKTAAVLTGNTPQDLPEMGYEDLIKRGYTPEVAKNVMQQRISTQEGISAEQQQIGEEGRAQAAEGIGFVGSITPGNLAMGAVKAPFMKSVVGGAAGLGSYEGLKTAAEGKSASEIFNNTLSGTLTGAVAGGVLHPIARGVAAVASLPGKFKGIADARRLKSLQQGALDFAKSFQPQWLETRFEDIVADPAATPEMLASLVMNKVLGQEAAQNATPEALAVLAKKIGDHLNYGRLDPALRDVTGGAGVPGLQAIGNDTATIPLQTRGLAPEATPPALEGPLGQQNPTFVPPAQVAPAEGLAPVVPQQAIPEPVVPEGPQIPQATPEMLPGAGVVPQLEPGPASLQSPTGAVPGPSLDPAAIPMETPVTPRVGFPNEMELGAGPAPVEEAVNQLAAAFGLDPYEILRTLEKKAPKSRTNKDTAEIWREMYPDLARKMDERAAKKKGIKMKTKEKK